MDKELIKENLTFLRLILTTCFAFLAGSMAWLVNNLETPNLLIYFDAFFILSLIGLILYTIAEIKYNINKLED